METEGLGWYYSYTMLPQLVELMNKLESCTESEIKDALILLKETETKLQAILESKG